MRLPEVSELILWLRRLGFSAGWAALLVLAAGFGSCGDDEDEHHETATPAVTASVTSGPATPAATLAPTLAPTLTSSPTPSPTPTATPSPTPSPSPTATPTLTPSPAPLAIDGARADAVAHEALPTTDDTGEDDWEVTKDDIFSSDPLQALRTDDPACAAVAGPAGVIRDLRSEALLARAQRELSKDGGFFAPIDTTVNTEVDVFGDADAPGAVVEAARAIITDATFPECFARSVDTPLLEGTGFDATVVPATREAPSGGFAAGIEIAIGVAGVDLTLHVETYVWQEANAAVQLTFISSSSADGDLLQRLLDAVDGRLKSAAGAGLSP
jgi:hypothetical protein